MESCREAQAELSNHAERAALRLLPPLVFATKDLWLQVAPSGPRF